jgi:hypothetical protein
MCEMAPLTESLPIRKLAIPISIDVDERTFERSEDSEYLGCSVTAYITSDCNDIKLVGFLRS